MMIHDDDKLLSMVKTTFIQDSAEYELWNGLKVTMFSSVLVVISIVLVCHVDTYFTSRARYVSPTVISGGKGATIIILDVSPVIQRKLAKLSTASSQLVCLLLHRLWQSQCQFTTTVLILSISIG